MRLLAEVKERVLSAQYEALKAVNTEPVGLYGDIGRMIVERQTDAENGSGEIILYTTPDGKNYRTKMYNLEAIISVGYRIRSHRGVQFR